MSDNKKYYYMRLKSDYFNSKEQILMEKLPDGYLYSNILLKLYLLALDGNGKLMFTDLIPYDATMIATLTRHQVGTVEKALQLFEKLKLIERLETGEIYMMDMQSLVGESKTEAERKREYRARIKAQAAKQLPDGGIPDKRPTNVPDIVRTNVRTPCPDNVPQRIETRDQSLELRDQRTETIITTSNSDRPDFNTVEAYATSNLEYLSPGNMEQLADFKNDLPDDVIRFAIDCACANGKRKWSYTARILQNWLSDGVKTLGDAKARNDSWNKSKEQPEKGSDSPWVW